MRQPITTLALKTLVVLGTIGLLGIVSLPADATPMPQIASPTQSNGCASEYASVPYFVDARTRWTYFQDTVVSMAVNGQGLYEVVFAMEESAMVFPSGAPQTHIDAAQKSLTDGQPVHVAIDNAGGDRNKEDFDLPQRKDQIQWVDEKAQHSSCN